MYRVHFENLSPEVEAAIRTLVPDQLNRVALHALGIGESLIGFCFGKDALPGQKYYDDFDTKRKKINEYLNQKCDLLTFKGRNLNNVPQGAYAFMRFCCWQDNIGGATAFRSAGGAGTTLKAQSDFLPSGTRVHLFAANFAPLKVDSKFNTIAHEITHRVITTTDTPDGTNVVYGWPAARALRDKSSEAALRCAENWGYFYENVRDRFLAGTT